MRHHLVSVVLSAFIVFSLRGQTTYNETITMRDGIGLDATITIPSDTIPSGGFPGVVLIHGYGGNKNDMAPLASILVSNGYATLAYSVRGQGNSGGYSTTMGETERLDLDEVIQYFRGSHGVSREKIGVAGDSQGGIHAWMAATFRMAGVAVVVPTYATPHFAEDLIPDNCVERALAQEMSLSTVRYAPERDRVRDHIINDQYDSVFSYIEPRDLEGRVDSVQIPVFQGLGWNDALFPANAGIRAAANLSARGVPVWSYYGTNGHQEPLNFNEILFLLKNSVEWLNHWLKGISLDQADTPLVFYLDDRPDWPHHLSTGWPPALSGTLRLYIGEGGLVPTLPASDDTLSFSLQYDPAYSPTDGWYDLYAGSRFRQAFNSTPIRLLSPPLADSVDMTGIPRVHLVTGSDVDRYQAHVRLFDVFGTDTGFVWQLMTRGTNGVRGIGAGVLSNAFFECSALSHRIPPGHRIGAEITSLDMDGDSSAHIIPYFLTSHSRLYSSAADPSYVDIPIVGSITLEGVEQDIASAPKGFVLEQNYPNPFNPTTVISYQLPVVSEVKLVVYDILGREVSVLVDGKKAAGSYDEKFEASGLASGVYFCRLTAGIYAQTRKMILVR
jgi:predicted acyl esterase